LPPDVMDQLDENMRRRGFRARSAYISALIERDQSDNVAGGVDKETLRMIMARLAALEDANLDA